MEEYDDAYEVLEELIGDTARKIMGNEYDYNACLTAITSLVEMVSIRHSKDTMQIMHEVENTLGWVETIDNINGNKLRGKANV